jgi:preprotein translocase subunit SecD
VARSGNASRPVRTLLVLVTLLAVLFGSIAAGVVLSNAQWNPKLALDLAGGTEIILRPKPLAGGPVNPTKDQLNEAVSIIRQRVNGSGVSEAEVTTQNGNNIVVSIPGKPDEKTLNLVRQSAQLTFRAVLVEQLAAPVATPKPTATPTPTGTAKPKPTGTAKPAAKATPAPSATNGRLLPQALTKAAALPKAAPTVDPNAAAAASAATPSAPANNNTIPDPVSTPDAQTPNPSGATANAAAAGTPSDLAQITQAVGDQFTKETCNDLNKIQAQVADPKKLLVTCDTEGTYKYILGPVEIQGTDIKSATSGLGTDNRGFSNGQWMVNLNFKGAGTKKFAAVTERLATLTGSQNQFAVVLDGLVVSAPKTNERIPTGQAQISGSFTQASSSLLASQLKFGSLPVSFEVQTSDTISAVLGGQQLRSGLLAGLIGLILVVLYSLLQYRALGLVTIFSLFISAAFTYGTVVLLSWTEGYRLSLAGVTGLIVAIGITADSFIVYFERVRDEVREGRPLSSAVEAAWTRGRRTFLISDAVSFLAAVVLYVLAAGSVKGFAFTLGLTTLIDVLVVFMFTKPTVTLLSRTQFFGGGHPLSGFSAEQLGRTNAPAYVGRGRVRTPGQQSIAARRAAELAELAEREGDPDDSGSDPDQDSDDAGGRSRQRKSNGRVPAGRTTGNRRDV